MRTRQKARLEAAAQISEGPSVVDEEESTKPKQFSDESSDTVTLSSSLNPGPTPDLYFSCDPNKMLDTLLSTGLRGSQVSRVEEVLKDCVITADFERRDCAPPISVSKRQQKKINQVS